MVTNCKNCGAPLVNSKCVYCETEYSGNEFGIPIYSAETGEYITTLLPPEMLTPNEARKLAGLREI